MDITKDLNYQEGYWSGESVAKNIERTTYKNIETAIAVKQKVIDNFEEQFGYTKENFNDDSNYSYNYGMLVRLKEESEK